MTTSTFPDPETPDVEPGDTGDERDTAQDPPATDGPRLTSDAERKVSDDLGNLTGD